MSCCAKKKETGKSKGCAGDKEDAGCCCNCKCIPSSAPSASSGVVAIPSGNIIFNGGYFDAPVKMKFYGYSQNLVSSYITDILHPPQVG